MDEQAVARHRGRRGHPFWLHTLGLVCLSALFESWFVHYGLNRYDEGWTLYAAMRLHGGGVLYSDTFFVFPPGHLLAAWIGYAVDPPGLLIARWIYAAFTVALCGTLYLLGCRLMPPRFALLGAALVAVAAPRSHLMQLLFGYRYLLFSILALLAFSRRLRTGDGRWMLAAGASAGLALLFRLTPAFAVSAGIGVAVAAASRDWRVWAGDWARFAAGLVVPVLPALLWLQLSVGLDVVWREVVVRVLALQDLQSLPVPPLSIPRLDRDSLTAWFVALQFRAFPLLYAAYIVSLGTFWIRALHRRERFEHALLLAVVLFGAIHFLRTLGRSDAAHLDSALPPACLLLAHAVSLPFRGRPEGARWAGLSWATGLGIFLAWGFMLGSDRYASASFRGTVPITSLGGNVVVRPTVRFRALDRKITLLRQWTSPGDTILDLTWSPLFHVLADRPGPGYSDIIMPGTFLRNEEERGFLRRLEESPPAAVIWPYRAFDNSPYRSITRTAPRVVDWVRENYVVADGSPPYLLMVPHERAGGGPG